MAGELNLNGLKYGEQVCPVNGTLSLHGDYLHKQR